MLRDVHAARSLVRAIALALSTEPDADYMDDADRWCFMFGEVHARLKAVREVLLSTCSVPPLDGCSPLAIAEAITMALWGAVSTGSEESEALQPEELRSAANALIDSLDSLLRHCEAAGVCRAAGLEPPSALH